MRKPIIWSLIVLTACNSGGTSKEKGIVKVPKTYNELVQENTTVAPTQDSIGLGFYLGALQQEVNANFSRLVNSGKVKGPRNWNSNGLTFDDAYPYTLYVSAEESIQTYIVHNFWKGKLSSFTFFAENNGPVDLGKLKRWMEERYGDYELVEQRPNGGIKFYWFDGYKQVALSRVGDAFLGIEFTDLRSQVEKETETAAADSINKADGKEKFEKSKNDLK